MDHIDQFNRLENLIATDPTTHPQYIRLAVRMDLQRRASRKLLALGVPHRWMMNPVRRRTDRRWTVGAGYIEVTFWPDVPKLTLKSPPSLCLSKMPTTKSRLDQRGGSWHEYGPPRFLSIHDIEIYPQWSLDQVVAIICEALFYCPQSLLQKGALGRALGIPEIDGEQASAQRVVVNEAVHTIYRTMISTAAGRCYYEDDGGEPSSQIRPLDVASNLANNLTQIISTAQETFANVTGATLRQKVNRDEVFVTIIDLMKIENAHKVENLFVGIMRGVFENYGQDARDFIAARMIHVMLGGTMQPALPIPPPEGDADFGPWRATPFEHVAVSTRRRRGLPRIRGSQTAPASTLVSAT